MQHTLSTFLNEVGRAEVSVEQALITEIVILCPQCHDSVNDARSIGGRKPNWSWCCEDHAVYVRIAADPEHMRWMRTQIRHLEGEKSQLEEALETAARIELGSHLINDPDLSEKQRTGYARRMDELVRQVKPAYDGLSSRDIQGILDQCRRDLVYWECQIRHATEMVTV